jgi:hypothetical protein
MRVDPPRNEVPLNVGPCESEAGYSCKGGTATKPALPIGPLEPDN